MLKRWVVAHRQACLGGPTGFLDGDTALKAYFTSRGAQKAVDKGLFIRPSSLNEAVWAHPLDQFIVRRSTTEDARKLARTATRRRGVVHYYDIPSIDGHNIPVHPSAQEQYKEQVDSILRMARATH